MRLHGLAMTAFGPFAGTESVDFDALNDAGLFLLSGATGAGKTSILDAVCFALFGTVPGVRGVKTLKSQHADDETAPEVVLEFSVRERRFRIRRSPEWSRPKRRGSGTMTEKAAASLIELSGGEEHFLTSRAAEVGLLVSELVGMRAAQFQQVAMLPQGEFQRFLQASSQDRHDVLQQLFQTDRFSQIEDWVQDHSRDLRERSHGGETTVRHLLHTFAELAGSRLPDAFSEEASSQALTPAAVLAWSDEQLLSARETARSTGALHADAERSCREVRDQLSELRRRADLVQRRDAARARLTSLAGSAEEAEAAERLLDEHRRSAGCRPLLQLLARALEERGAAAAERDRALAGLAGETFRVEETSHVRLGAETGDRDALIELAASLDRAEERMRDAATRLKALLPRVELLERTTRSLRTLEARIESAEAHRADAEKRRAQLPVRLAAARERLASNTAVAARAEALTLQVAVATTRASAAAHVGPATSEVIRLRDVVRDRRDDTADARDRVQRVTARRLAGMAAELAGRLEDGEPCGVCGSTAHPRPAAPVDDAVTEEEQEAAAAALEAAQDALVTATAAVTDAQHLLDAHVSAAEDRDEETARKELDAVCAEQQRAQAAAAQLDDLTRAVADVEQALADATTDVARLDSDLAALREQRTGHQALAEQIGGEVEALVGVHVAPTALPALVATELRQLDLVRDARLAVAAFLHADARVLQLEEQCGVTATDNGFESVAQMRAASLTEERRAALDQLLSERAELSASAAAVLADPEIHALGDVSAPELHTAEQTVCAAEAALHQAARSHHLVEQQATALADLQGRLAQSLATWAPLREEYVRAESMSRLVRGMGSDNHLQMRLSAYVLATRLDQVVDAANERLSHMRDQRYLLQRTGRAARKGAQAGLGLEILDQWTGDVRDPATLSGGETFVVSLSLALGLADVVTQEAGGTEIETLFVDEGFGTLDADTLDDVMDRLDGLRAGGRTVGVVSHVAEMRTRIPAQLHVRKSPHGSTVHAETLVG